ncbi:hypothetical protein SynNOUM97013_01935 [Synechococcus sp. NOUM97013]|nr:hypothetical protein SynNOUM97013_01935 [Synechococcus sp. NOUM97013]
MQARVGPPLFSRRGGVLMLNKSYCLWTAVSERPKNPPMPSALNQV